MSPTRRGDKAPGISKPMKKHKHAELMALYARDAAETDTPWERWEYKSHVSHEWEPCRNSPAWAAAYEYRRKTDDLSEAVAIATAIRDRFYPSSTDWEPLDTVSGVLSQISNMVSGLMPFDVHDEFLRTIIKALDDTGVPGGDPEARIAWLGKRVRELEQAVNTARAVHASFQSHVETALDFAGAATHHPDIGAPVRKPMMPSERIDWLAQRLREYKAGYERMCRAKD